MHSYRDSQKQRDVTCVTEAAKTLGHNEFQEKVAEFLQKLRINTSSRILTKATEWP